MNKNSKNNLNPSEQTNRHEQRFKTMLEVSLDGFCVIDLDGTIEEANAILCDFTGYPREELIGMNLADFDVIFSAEEILQRLDMIKKSGSARFESQSYRKDRKVIDVEVSVQFFSYDNEQYFLCFTRDITDRKRSIDKLEQSERAYRTLCRNIPGMVYRAAADWSVEIISNSESVCGYDSNDFDSQKVNWLDNIHSDDRARVLNEASQLEKSSSALIQEYRIITKNGGIRWVEDHKTSIVTHNGVFDGVHGVVYDITARKQAEEQLRDSEKRYKALFHGASEGILVCDIETKDLLYANPAICEMLGYTENELSGLHLHDIHPQAVIAKVLSEFEAITRGEKSFKAIFPCYRKDGTILYANINSATAIIDGRMCAIGFFTDTTEFKKIQDDLKASEARFRSLSDAAYEGIVIHDQFNIIDANQKYVEMFGYSLDELRNMDGMDTIAPDCREIVKGYVEAGQEGPYEVMCLRKDGSLFPVEVQAKRTQFHGRTVRVVAIKDISEQKQIEAERERYKDNLLKTQRHANISSMGEIVAHQVNQPLTRINILLDRTIEKCETMHCPPAALKDIKESLAEAQEAASIIRKYRLCLNDGSLPEIHPMNIHSVLNKIVTILSEKTQQAKIRITLTDLDPLPNIQINESAMELLVLQLILNAIEAADGQRQHHLDISGRWIDDQVELKFADDCCGIAPENLDKIFDPFFSTKTKDKGLGLGLDIVQKILLNCGGRIRVESRPGRGATFYITLPIENQ